MSVFHRTDETSLTAVGKLAVLDLLVVSFIEYFTSKESRIFQFCYHTIEFTIHPV